MGWQQVWKLCFCGAKREECIDAWCVSLSFSHLRYDTLAQMLTLGNIHAGSKVLVFETCSGLVLGAVMERMGGMSAILWTSCWPNDANFFCNVFSSHLSLGASSLCNSPLFPLPPGYGSVIQMYPGGEPVRAGVESFGFPAHFHDMLHDFPVCRVNALLAGTLDTTAKDPSAGKASLLIKTELSKVFIGWCWNAKGNETCPCFRLTNRLFTKFIYRSTKLKLICHFRVSSSWSSQIQSSPTSLQGMRRKTSLRQNGRPAQSNRAWRQAAVLTMSTTRRGRTRRNAGKPKYVDHFSDRTRRILRFSPWPFFCASVPFLWEQYLRNSLTVIN